MKRGFKPQWLLAAICGASLAQPLLAANAVYIPGFVGAGYSGGSIEVQGSSDRIDVPIAFQGTSVGPFLSVSGATGTDSTAYTLLSSAVPSNNSVLVKSDPHTGAVLETIPLDARLSDIAYANGHLYGIASTPTALQIYTIAANGTTSSVLNQSMVSSRCRRKMPRPVICRTASWARGQRR